MSIDQHIPANPHRFLFENQINCGICNAKMIRKQLHRQSNMRVYVCPACRSTPDSPAQNYQYPLNDLMYDAAKTIRKERRIAIRVGVKVLQAQQEQKVAAVRQYYRAKIDVCMDRTRSIVHSINELFVDNPPDEPFSVQTMRKYRSLQTKAEEQTAKAAEWADILLTFLYEFHLENMWYILYSTITEDFVLTRELARAVIRQIILTPGREPEILLNRRAERSCLENCMAIIDKVDISNLRKEERRHGK